MRVGVARSLDERMTSPPVTAFAQCSVVARSKSESL
jgi:hypothetical protein